MDQQWDGPRTTADQVTRSECGHWWCLAYRCSRDDDDQDDGDAA